MATTGVWVEFNGGSTGGDGPLPGTAAGSGGATGADVGAVELLPLTLVVAELPDVALEASLEGPPDPLDPVAALTDVSAPEPGVPFEDVPLELVDETVGALELSLVVLTEPETVGSLDPDAVVVTLDESTVVVDGVVAAGAGAFELGATIGEGALAVALLTSPGVEESASRRPFGLSAETVNGVLSSVACDWSVGVEESGAGVDVSAGAAAEKAAGSRSAGAPIESSVTGACGAGFLGFAGGTVVYALL